jgi:hypothetical protein
VLSKSTDTRLLVAGVIGFLALVVYLAVAFANTHASAGVGPNGAPYYGSWVPHNSKLTRLSSRKRKGLAFRVRPTGAGTYGALVPTLTSDPPPGHRFAVGLWLRGMPRGRVGIAIDEFSPGATSVYVVNTTVPVTSRWQHFTFRGRVKGRWLGLGMYVSRAADARKRNSFDVRGLTARLSRSRARG